MSHDLVVESGAVDEDDVEFAHRLVTAAAQAALPFATHSVEHRQKSDGSPVSEADLAAERAMLPSSSSAVRTMELRARRRGSSLRGDADGSSTRSTALLSSYAVTRSGAPTSLCRLTDGSSSGSSVDLFVDRGGGPRRSRSERLR
jgi:hypothetical protein